VFGHAHGPAIVRGFRPAALVATPIAEHLASEHDHMVLANPEIRIPAAFCQQRPGERLSKRAGYLIVCLEVQNVQTGGWAADTDPDMFRRLTRVSLRPTTLSSAPICKLSARRVPFTMDQALHGL
jgi:hypothetical protein